MAQLYGVDVSHYQGTIDWNALNAAANFVMIEVGDGTLLDPQFQRNQSEARRVQAANGPLGIGYYYFADPTLLAADESAAWFLATVGQLEEGEILALDLEGALGPDPVGWALEWLRYAYNHTLTKPLVYLNQSTMTGYDWSQVVTEGYGLWVADYDGSKTSVPPSGQWPVVAMKQWSDVDVVNGVPAKVDGDTFFGDFATFAQYGYQPQAVVAPPVAPPSPTPPLPPVAPAIPPPVAPVPPNSQTTAIPVRVTPPSPLPVVTPTVSLGPYLSSLFNSTLGRAFLSAFATVLTPIIMNLQNFHTQNEGLAAGVVAAVGTLLTVRDLLNNRLPNLPK